jgi:glycosyltransferase involved in cell wall biosynthesis
VVGTWRNAVDVYITPSEFTRQKYIQGGFPADRLVVKPNFVHPDPGVGMGEGGYVAFVGRLSPEKGLDTLLSAWARLGMTVPLKIVGDGPLADDVRAAAARFPHIEWLGRMKAAQVYDFIGRARLLVVPSNCYETFGRVAVEAFAKGVPVVAADHGALSDIVEDGRTGALFKGGDAEDLARQVQRMLGDAGTMLAMRQAVRNEFLEKYTGETNIESLMAIYRRAIHSSRTRQTTSSKPNDQEGLAYN